MITTKRVGMYGVVPDDDPAIAVVIERDGARVVMQRDTPIDGVLEELRPLLEAEQRTLKQPY